MVAERFEEYLWVSHAVKSDHILKYLLNVSNVHKHHNSTYPQAGSYIINNDQLSVQAPRWSRHSVGNTH